MVSKLLIQMKTQIVVSTPPSSLDFVCKELVLYATENYSTRS